MVSASALGATKVDRVYERKCRPQDCTATYSLVINYTLAWTFSVSDQKFQTSTEKIIGLIQIEALFNLNSNICSHPDIIT